ncbi:MAG TPA: UDP-N-acetylmuramoyl-tripeptide--D-alanyl-D-alanine ligase [Thermoanaerobaculaceae bacterium]|nr:UDP-N-acetylmuramoyl-tripeptide--D-alanyl-D-alanine ligase [Thermoanaerobaculaceae bacterium]HRS16347.1 UDP-N-acetylmuramoyl-tripeptide--D-alanyl-D-alanine ligase [Thermoanaerobaculaceae bacterium]
MRRRVAELAGVLGAPFTGNGAAVVTGVATDSRAVRPGDLFVALPGARVDGHDFVPQAAAGGAAAALVTRALDVALPRILVGDTLAALGALARHERAHAGFELVALTGSIGKTTTKDMLVALLGAAFPVGFTRGNRNSEIGFPAELCSQPEGIRWMVAELGMSHAGELDRLGAVASPDALLFTVVAPVHLEFFPDVEAIAEAKAELIPHLRPDGVLILNAADPHVARFDRRFAGRIVRYGAPGSDFWLDEFRSEGWLGSSFSLRSAAGSLPIRLPLAGRHQAENLLAAAATALTLGVPPGLLIEAASTLRPAPRRGEVHRLRNGIVLVDDTYNASPSAMARVLEMLAASPGRRVAVLGEMLELGPTAPELHRRVGEQAAVAADLVLAVGLQHARALAEGAGDRCLRTVPDAAAALAELRAVLRSGDVVLVKASRGIGLDRVVDGLLEELQ